MTFYTKYVRGAIAPRSARGKRRQRKYISAGVKALKIARSIKSIINVEKKFKDTAATLTPNATTGDLLVLNATSQDDTHQGRDGNSIKSLYVNIKGHVTQHGSAATTLLRLILVLDKNPRMVEMTVAQLLDATGTKIVAM